VNGRQVSMRNYPMRNYPMRNYSVSDIITYAYEFMSGRSWGDRPGLNRRSTM
jgi:hypothetical protein